MRRFFELGICMVLLCLFFSGCQQQDGNEKEVVTNKAEQKVKEKWQDEKSLCGIWVMKDDVKMVKKLGIKHSRKIIGYCMEINDDEKNGTIHLVFDKYNKSDEDSENIEDYEIRKYKIAIMNKVDNRYIIQYSKGEREFLFKPSEDEITASTIHFDDSRPISKGLYTGSDGAKITGMYVTKETSLTKGLEYLILQRVLSNHPVD